MVLQYHLSLLQGKHIGLQGEQDGTVWKNQAAAFRLSSVVLQGPQLGLRCGCRNREQWNGEGGGARARDISSCIPQSVSCWTLAASVASDWHETDMSLEW